MTDGETTEAPRLGRPSDYTAEIALTICARLADGESLRSICRDDDMPDKATVFRWLLLPEREDFRDQYARAREMQADSHVDDMTDIADDGTNDWMERKNADGSTGDIVLNGEHIQRSRLRVDTRKWIAERMKPKKYGSKLALTDPDGGPLQVTVRKFSERHAVDKPSGE